MTEDLESYLIDMDGVLVHEENALPGADEKKYLIEEVSLAVLPVPQALFDLLAARPDKTDAPSLLAMGDVDFDAVAGSLGVAAERIARGCASDRRRVRPVSRGLRTGPRGAARTKQ